MKNNSTKMFLIFLAGLIIGGAIVWFFFCCKKQCNGKSGGLVTMYLKSEPATIDTVTANMYFNYYMQSPDSAVPFKAFAVNLAQYDAMTKIWEADSTVTGFRIYMGAMDTIERTRITMVVGFGSPDHYETIYATDSEESGPCPFVCDETSPIVQPPK